LQLTWLKQDLASVDRTTTPWVVAFGHKQGWMDSVEFTDLESALQGHVDLYFAGHQHNYQRLLPQAFNVPETACVNSDQTVYSGCTNMTTVIAGSPGCREDLSSGHAPEGVATYLKVYGYGRLTVHNATALSWQFDEVKSVTPAGKYVTKVGAVSDAFWLLK
jgi:hypothetical protein